jgi:hypothetical protein
MESWNVVHIHCGIILSHKKDEILSEFIIVRVGTEGQVPHNLICWWKLTSLKVRVPRTGSVELGEKWGNVDQWIISFIYIGVIHSDMVLHSRVTMGNNNVLCFPKLWKNFESFTIEKLEMFEEINMLNLH